MGTQDRVYVGTHAETDCFCPDHVNGSNPGAFKMKFPIYGDVFRLQGEYGKIPKTNEHIGEKGVALTCRKIKRAYEDTTTKSTFIINHPVKGQPDYYNRVYYTLNEADIHKVKVLPLEFY